MKIFISNIEVSATEDDLRVFLLNRGFNVAEAKLVRDRDGKSRGYAFVEIEDQVAGEMLIKTLDGKQLLSRRLNIQEAHPPRRRSTPLEMEMPHGQSR